MADHNYNLDEGIQEYFEFTVKGHSYKFRFLTTEEAEKIKELKDDEKGIVEYLYKFIDPVSENAPPFVEIAKKMTIPHMIAFNKMVMTEFGLPQVDQNANDKS